MGWMTDAPPQIKISWFCFRCFVWQCVNPRMILASLNANGFPLSLALQQQGGRGNIIVIHLSRFPHFTAKNHNDPARLWALAADWAAVLAEQPCVTCVPACHTLEDHCDFTHLSCFCLFPLLLIQHFHYQVMNLGTWFFYYTCVLLFFTLDVFCTYTKYIWSEQQHKTKFNGSAVQNRCTWFGLVDV